MFKIRQTDDIDDIRELHELSFEADRWVGDDHQFWISYADDGRPVGFCSASYLEKHNVVLLSRAAVVLAAQGHGLQRRMINVRVAWARRIEARRVVTYTTPKNYASITNLLRCGFHFYTPTPDSVFEPLRGVRDEYHFFRRDINGHQAARKNHR